MDALDEPSLASALESLPIDIHRLIFQHLCPHCLTEPGAPGNVAVRAEAGRQALRALSMCSKKIRPVALSFLAHRTSSEVPLRTLISALERNPYIGAEVKELVLCLHQKISDDEFDFFKQVAQRLPTPIGETPDMENTNEKSLAHNAFILRLALALTPHVNALWLKVGEFREMEFTDSQFRRLQEYGDSDEGEDSDDDEDDEDGEEDESEEEGFDHGPLLFTSKNLQPLDRDCLLQGIRHLTLDYQPASNFCFSYPRLASLLGATINLKHLKVRNAIGGKLDQEYSSADFDVEEMTLALQNLEILELEDCIFNDDSETSEFAILAKIIASAPKLHTFKFRPSMQVWRPRFADNILSPIRVLRALLPRRGTLKHIGLDFLNAGDSNKERIKQFHLSGFTALNSLMVSENCCYGYQNWGSREYFLVRTIPTQLEHLYLVFEPRQWYCPHVEHLAQQASNGCFPALKRLTFGCSSRLRYWNGRIDRIDYPDIIQRMETIRNIFEGTGISMNFAGPLFHDIKAQGSEKVSWVEMVDE